MDTEPIIEVYLKKDIKFDHMWEDGPHLIAGIYLAITMFLFFGGMIALIIAGCPQWLVGVYEVGICVIDIVVTLFLNEMCNISKSIAILRLGGELYMVKLGYLEDIDYHPEDLPDGTQLSHDIAVAEQVQYSEQELWERRKSAEVFVYALKKTLENGKMPDGVMQCLHLVDARVEKETRGYIWISYQAADGRKTKMFRNAYDIEI